MVSNERAFIVGTISFLLLLAVSSQVRHLGDMKHEEEVVLQYQLKKTGLEPCRRFNQMLWSSTGRK